MRGWLIAWAVCAALTLANCSFDEGGVPANNDASTQDATVVDGTTSADAPVSDALVVDGSQPIADGRVPDAPVPDAQIPDAQTPDANLCAPCFDGIACTDDNCDPGTGACSYDDNCPGITTCNMGTQVCDGDITFVDSASYVGTQDTRLSENNASTSYGTNNQWAWDADEPNGSGNEIVGLIRFLNIFSPSRVPVGATIVSATLSVVVENGSAGPAGGVYEVTRDWNESTTWNTFGPVPGVQVDDFGASVATAPSLDCTPTCGQTEVVDVTSSIATWVLDDSTMRGWAFIALSGDGMYVASSEATPAATRPSLRIIFTVPPP